jgi:hypothetical protein
MSANEVDKGTSGKGARILLSLVVILGITLFIIGFVMTVISLSDASTASAVNAGQLDGLAEGSASSNAGTLLLGLTLSMTGLVVATTVPAARFIRASKNRS